MFTVGIVTLSDKGAAGNREDLSGVKIKEMLPDDLYQVLSYRILPDEQKEIEQELVRLSDELHCDLVLTTGGTGFSTRDVTPEATMQVAERNAPGIAEAIRAYSMTITRRAMLSRGVSVIRGKTLIINLPGSPKAVEESLGYILRHTHAWTEYSSGTRGRVRQMSEKIVFCKGGGCTAKLGAGVLSRVLEKLPKGPMDENLLVGYDSRDDAAVYRISDDIAIVQTLDFFPPMVEDPYTFGQIAAANALSDVYAMGGEVKTALNIVCFPEQMDLNILGAIMRGRRGKSH